MEFILLSTLLGIGQQSAGEKNGLLALCQDAVQLGAVAIFIDHGDGAGIHAALRGIGLILKEGMNVKVVLLPDGQDPDDFAKSHSLDQVNDYISANEQDFISFKTEMLLGEAGSDPLKRAELINDIADTIALIPDAVVRAMYVRSSSEKFDIDERLILDRINSSRTTMIVAEQKQKERERQKAEVQISAEAPVAEAPVVVQSNSPVKIEEPYLAPCEKDLLGFILEEGCTNLDFDRDSKYYMEGQECTVADFIDGILAEDEADFVNSSYRKVYEAYFSLYEEGLTQSQIQARLLNSEDPEIEAVARDLLIEKYQITVSNYEKSLTAVSTRLVIYVPKALLAYQCKKVELVLRKLTEELSEAEAADDIEAQGSILARIGDYNRARTRLHNELGRV